jgi:hypothetical protein
VSVHVRKTKYQLPVVTAQISMNYGLMLVPGFLWHGVCWKNMYNININDLFKDSTNTQNKIQAFPHASGISEDMQRNIIAMFLWITAEQATTKWPIPNKETYQTDIPRCKLNIRLTLIYTQNTVRAVLSQYLGR